MRFVWDDQKNAANIRKHGLSFSDAARMFSGIAPLLMEPDVRQDYGEDRWMGLGQIGETVAVVIFTYNASANAIRIISLRKADKDEQSGYFTQVH